MLTDVISHRYHNDHASIQVEIKLSGTAKRYILKRKINTQIFILTIPKKGNKVEAMAFLRRSSGWIARQMEKSTPKMAIGHGSLISIRGIHHQIDHRPNSRGVVWVEPQETSNTDDDVRNPHKLCVAGSANHIERRVKDYLKKQALLDYTAASNALTKRINVHYSKIRIGDPKTRWGSCSSNGVLSFSWRIIMAPQDILFYLTAHEVAHLRHMNHSSAFWKCVAELDPNWKTSEHWLKKEGSKLHSVI